MAFGQDFLKAFFGNDYLKDYRHAAKTFRTNGYANSPRFKYLFHVYFNLNTDIPKIRNVFDQNQSSTIGLLVKNIELPKYEIDTDVLNQYNRKRVIQKRINYQPIQVRFHDDGDDLIRRMWYNYFSYYYKDPNQKYGSVTNTNGNNIPSQTQSNGGNLSSRDIYAGERLVNDWGFIGESYSDGATSDSQASPGGKPPFFRDVWIYGFNQHKWVSYVLINPLITSWSHDQYDYSQDTGIMENSMTLAYETVKYYEGAIGGDRADTNVQGFADPAVYDQEKSPLSRPGGTRSVLGQGGLVDTGIGIIGDLTSNSVTGVIAGIQKAGTARQTFKGVDIKDVALEEALGGVKGVLRSDIGGVNSTQSIQQTLGTPIFPTPGQRG